MNNTFQLDISSWTFPWAVDAASEPQPKEKITAFQSLTKAKELGVSLVQIADNLSLEKLLLLLLNCGLHSKTASKKH